MVVVCIVNVIQMYVKTVPAYAETIPLSQIAVGKVVSVNGLKFVKVGENRYMAAEKVDVCSLGATGEMQTWTGCASLLTPTYTEGVQSTYFTQGPCLTDSRDGKSYEVRKFPDGKCWMVDSLAYGGAVDACAGKTTFDGCGNGGTAMHCDNGSSKSGSAWGYGDCLDLSVSSGGNNICATVNPSTGSSMCGYSYNWQAAMQEINAYYGGSYTTLSYPHQGICPTGWHLPRGGDDDNNEFVALDKAVGGTGASQPKTDYVAFWELINISWRFFDVSG
jgi:hypothetical protein